MANLSLEHQCKSLGSAGSPEEGASIRLLQVFDDRAERRSAAHGAAHSQPSTLSSARHAPPSGADPVEAKQVPERLAGSQLSHSDAAKGPPETLARSHADPYGGQLARSAQGDVINLGDDAEIISLSDDTSEGPSSSASADTSSDDEVDTELHRCARMGAAVGQLQSRLLQTLTTGPAAKAAPTPAHAGTHGVTMSVALPRQSQGAPAGAASAAVTPAYAHGRGTASSVALRNQQQDMAASLRSSDAAGEARSEGLHIRRRDRKRGRGGKRHPDAPVPVAVGGQLGGRPAGALKGGVQKPASKGGCALMFQVTLVKTYCDCHSCASKDCPCKVTLSSLPNRESKSDGSPLLAVIADC